MRLHTRGSGAGTIAASAITLMVPVTGVVEVPNSARTITVVGPARCRYAVGVLAGLLALILQLALVLPHSGASTEQVEAQRGVVCAAGRGTLPTSQRLGVLIPPSSARTVLTRLTPMSLRPRGRRVVIGEYHRAWSFSPDRSQVALATSQPSAGGRIGIRIVDTARMRVRKDVMTGIAPEAIAWLASDRLVAVLLSGEVVVVDPTSGKIVQRWDMSAGARFYFPKSAGTPEMLVALLVGTGKLRPARLVVVDRDGRLRSTWLGRIRVGQRRVANNLVVPQSAGLALDPAGNRAWVSGAGAPLAAVDLDTMQVRYHSLRSSAATTATGGAVVSSDRRALWLGPGRLAIFGDDYVSGRSRRAESSPSGVHIVNTRRWTSHTIAKRATAARIAAGRLLVYTPRHTPGAGLGIHTQAGRQLHHLFGNRTLDVQVAGRYAYAISDRTLRVVDVRSGKVVHKAKRPPHAGEIELLAPARIGQAGSSSIATRCLAPSAS